MVSPLRRRPFLALRKRYRFSLLLVLIVVVVLFGVFQTFVMVENSGSSKNAQRKKEEEQIISTPFGE